MAGATQIRGRDVLRAFAYRGRPIMATHAGADRLRVINCSHGPIRNGLVACLTQIAGCNMSDALAARYRAIVATKTIAGIHFGVIKLRGRPRAYRMAITTSLCGAQMRWAHTTRNGAVMAALARPENFCMIYGGIGNNPVAIRRVARATDIGCIDVSRAFPTPVFASIVTIRTNLRTNLRRAVRKLRRFPSGRCMANATGIR